MELKEGDLLIVKQHYEPTCIGHVLMFLHRFDTNTNFMYCRNLATGEGNIYLEQEVEKLEKK